MMMTYWLTTFTLHAIFHCRVNTPDNMAYKKSYFVTLKDVWNFLKKHSIQGEDTALQYHMSVCKLKLEHWLFRAEINCHHSNFVNYHIPLCGRSKQQMTTTAVIFAYWFTSTGNWLRVQPTTAMDGSSSPRRSFRLYLKRHSFKRE